MVVPYRLSTPLLRAPTPPSSAPTHLCLSQDPRRTSQLRAETSRGLAWTQSSPSASANRLPHRAGTESTGGELCGAQEESYVGHREGLAHSLPPLRPRTLPLLTTTSSHPPSLFPQPPSRNCSRKYTAAWAVPSTAPRSPSHSTTLTGPPPRGAPGPAAIILTPQRLRASGRRALKTSHLRLFYTMHRLAACSLPFITNVRLAQSPHERCRLHVPAPRGACWGL